MVHQYAARCGAALTRGTYRTENDGRHGEVQIRAFIHDDRVVAAELQQALAEALGHAHAHLASDVRRTREGHQCDTPIVDEFTRQLGAGIDEYLEYGRQRATLEHAVADLLYCKGAQRRLRGGLPHRGVAADGGEECVPGPHGHGKIKRGDHTDHAERVPLLVHAVLRALRMHGQAVQHARLADGEIGNVDHFLYFTVALGLDLAVLQRNQDCRARPCERVAPRRSVE